MTRLTCEVVPNCKGMEGTEMKVLAVTRVCQIFCVNDLDFVVGLGFVFGFVVGLGFAVVVGFGDGVQGKGAFSPSLAYLRRRKPEIALCQSPWPGHALGPQDGE